MSSIIGSNCWNRHRRDRHSMQSPASPLVRGVTRLALLGAALGMLAMPMGYRGGEKEAHPHAIFQLLSDAARGSVDHHHPGENGTLHGHRAGHDRLAESPTDVVISRAEADPDLPRLTGTSSSRELSPILAAVAVLAMLPVLVLAAAPFRRAALLSGRPVWPEPPPPRLGTLS